MALTNSYGSLSKTNKVQVMHVLEEHGSPSKDPELFPQDYVSDKENTGVLSTIWHLCKSVHHVLR